jgi:hypothetical protein
MHAVRVRLLTRKGGLVALAKLVPSGRRRAQDRHAIGGLYDGRLRIWLVPPVVGQIQQRHELQARSSRLVGVRDAAGAD